MSKYIITQYIRNRKGRRIGVLVAYRPRGEEVYIGTSLCHPSDHFDEKGGFDFAMKRIRNMLRGHYDPDYFVPHSIQKDVDRFAYRAMKYFQTERILVPPPMPIDI